ncbi:hypothetical protein [Arthrobacter sp. B6]|uniref:hypothetical protein n=1 Tax=Arthrobacter sp. B6 TaxID=1570137 RepID=UPI000B2616BD|nr:hypothetical protein [Arthrobacter sp. B6]
MAIRRNATKRAAAAAVALVLPLWLGSCAPGTEFPAGTVASERTAPPAEPLTPIPQPQAAPPLGSVGAGSPTGSPAPSGDTPTSAPSDGTPTEPDDLPSSASSGSGTGSGSTGQAQAGVSGTAPAAEPPPVQTRAPDDPPLGNAAGTHSVTAYYVLLDDGGSSGVRFGCNDSLVGVKRSNADSADPLPAAIRALLDGSAPPIADVYNSLSGSTLNFLAGSFDGTTVTVYLAGTMRPGGVCDIPRIEAQLTQTAVSAVGAIRAEIYVNGEGLAEALSLK